MAKKKKSYTSRLLKARVNSLLRGKTGAGEHGAHKTRAARNKKACRRTDRRKDSWD